VIHYGGVVGKVVLSTPGFGSSVARIVLTTDIPKSDPQAETGGGCLIIYLIRGWLTPCLYSECGVSGKTLSGTTISDNSTKPGSTNSYSIQGFSQGEAFPKPGPSQGYYTYAEFGFSSDPAQVTYARNSDGHPARGRTLVEPIHVDLRRGYSIGDTITLTFPDTFDYIAAHAFYYFGDYLFTPVPSMLASWHTVNEGGFDQDVPGSALATSTYNKLLGSGGTQRHLLAFTTLQGSRWSTDYVHDGDTIDDASGRWERVVEQDTLTGVINIDYNMVYSIWAQELVTGGAGGTDKPWRFTSSPSRRGSPASDSPYSGVVATELWGMEDEEIAAPPSTPRIYRAVPVVREPQPLYFAGNTLLPTESSLFRYTAGLPVLVGAMGEDVSALAYDPTSSTMFGATTPHSNTPSHLVRVNLLTGNAIVVGGFGGGVYLSDMAVAGGTLFGLLEYATTGYPLVTIDKTTGQATSFVTPGMMDIPTFSGGLFCRASDGFLYAVIGTAPRHYDFGGDTWQINPATGAAVVFTAGANWDIVYAMSEREGVVYQLQEDRGYVGYRYDVGTGNYFTFARLGPIP